MRRIALRIGILLLAGLGVAFVLIRTHFDGEVGAAQEEWRPPGGPAVAAIPIAREPCAHHDPLRQAFFGDLHVHTGYSHDAAALDVTLTPEDAYRFATGETVRLPPLDELGRPTRDVQIDRPLDFAAVTDHAEWLAETALCRVSGSPSYDAFICRAYRGETWAGPLGRLLFQLEIRGRAKRSRAICGEDAADCRVALGDRWQRTQAAAENAYDRSAGCDFTTFHAYEHSRRRKGFMLHRNVIFRNEIVPELPISWIEAPEPADFWRLLRERCLDTESGCDALSIPHNTNYSSGQAFEIGYRSIPATEQPARAALRAGIEPLVEIVQAKGESECRNGFASVLGAPDEACDFEKTFELDRAELEPCRPGEEPGDRCWGALSYARYGLSEGLYEQARIGVNPLKYGFIGSTDTHNATPGDVSETSVSGHMGAWSTTVEGRLSTRNSFGQPAPITANPGGLAGLWAEENSRDALFDAMRRKEAFATSGPRIQPRFFGGWSFEDDLCERPDLVTAGYAAGVPMGGDLPPLPSSSAAPEFVVHARRDPGSEAIPANSLQRLQIVKVWSEGKGRYGQAIYDVAGSVDASQLTTVGEADLARCEPLPRGAESLCAVWRDPDFDPEAAVAYYARVFENPSCRWSWRQCLSLPEEKRPESCSDPAIPRSIRERAWTSPIWYSPAEN